MPSEANEHWHHCFESSTRARRELSGGVARERGDGTGGPGGAQASLRTDIAGGGCGGVFNYRGDDGNACDAVEYREGTGTARDTDLQHPEASRDFREWARGVGEGHAPA